jgi:predicted O-methyltransferase YrrM
MEIDPKNGLFIPGYLEDYLDKKLLVLKPKNALEFGTGTGAATEILAKHCDIVNTYEAHNEWVDFAKNKLKKYDNIVFNCGYFHTLMPTKEYKYDLVFVDGPKGAPGIERITPFLFQWENIKHGATCIFDDANQKGVRNLFKLLKEFFSIDYKIDNKERGIGEFIKP